MVNLLHVSVTGYSSKKFFVIISIIVSSLIIDISLSNISDIISVSTSWGFSAFIAIVIVYAVRQYLILDFVKQKSRRIRSKSPHFNKLITSSNNCYRYCSDSDYCICYFANICKFILLYFSVNLEFVNQLCNCQYYNGNTCTSVLLLVQVQIEIL